MYRHILVATDGSEISARAEQHGVALARAVGARVSFLTTTDPFHIFSLAANQVEAIRPEFEKEAATRAANILSSAGRGAAAAGVAFDTVHRESDQPSDVILEVAASRDCDLIVMGSHGRRGVSAVVLGSVTMKVLAQTRTPVLVVR